MITFFIPIRTYPQSNGARSCHWRVVAERVKEQRGWGRLFAENRIGDKTKCKTRLRIKLIRVSPGTMDTGDNLPGVLKHIRDGIADGMGFKNDNDPRMRWSYDQRKPRDGEDRYGVEVQFKETAR